MYKKYILKLHKFKSLKMEKYKIVTNYTKKLIHTRIDQK